MWVLLFLVIETEVKLKLVKEWKFDKPILKVGWAETQDGELYPRFVFLSGEFRLYNNKNEIKFTKKCTQSKYIINPRYYLISRNYEFVALPIEYKHPSKFTSGYVVYEVFDTTGDEQYKVKFDVDYEYGKPQIRLLNDGKLVSFNGILATSDKKVKIPYSDIRDVGLSISPSGNWVVITTGPQGAFGPSAYTLCIIFDKNLNKIWEYKSPPGYRSTLSWSEDEKYIVISEDKGALKYPQCHVFNALTKQKIITIDALGKWRIIKDTFYLVPRKDSSIYIVDLQSKIIAKRNLQGIEAFPKSKKQNILFAKTDFKYSSNRAFIYIYFSDGQNFYKTRIVKEKEKICGIPVEIVKDVKFYAINGTELKLYSIEFEKEEP